MSIICYDKSDWQEGVFAKILSGVLIGRLIYANNRFWGHGGKGSMKGKYQRSHRWRRCNTVTTMGNQATLWLLMFIIEFIEFVGGKAIKTLDSIYNVTLKLLWNSVTILYENVKTARPLGLHYNHYVSPSVRLLAVSENVHNSWTT